ncbi:DUF397 domain-containing protein [Streptomyces sp. NPDC002490]|uniref:DUF397 domain-containing protein n=1 Tax=Streptomyces sp. NPDC002490 TaxID=3154416 RepID=UPI00331F07AB
MISASELPVTWRASTYSSTNGGNCVEVGEGLPGVVPVRDSKVPAGAALVFGAEGWTRFLAFAVVERG